jgi:hypothetical protein
MCPATTTYDIALVSLPGSVNPLPLPFTTAQGGSGEVCMNPQV